MSAATLELALCDWVDLAGGVKAVTQTGPDLSDLVAEHGVVVRVHRTGGRDLGWQQIIRIGLEIWGTSYAETWGAAERVHRRFIETVGGFRASGWRIDRVVSESSLTVIPHENLRLIQAALRVTTRQYAPDSAHS